MTAKQLESLLIDQTLGELSEEASALLESYLIQFPERLEEATRVRRAIGLTEAAVLSRPLFCGLDAEENPGVLPFVGRRTFFPAAVYRVAAALVLLGVAAGTGFFAGKGSRETSHLDGSVAESPLPAVTSPWARYHFEESGRLAVISSSQPKKL